MTGGTFSRGLAVVGFLERVRCRGGEIVEEKQATGVGAFAAFATIAGVGFLRFPDRLAAVAADHGVMDVGRGHQLEAHTSSIGAYGKDRKRFSLLEQTLRGCLTRRLHATA